MFGETQLMTYEMDSAQQDDQMELATSPYRQADDIDFEDLDPMHDLSVDNSMLDDTEIPTFETDFIHADEPAIYQDDDMIDEEDKEHIPEAVATEFDQVASTNDDVGEDEVLYDEDEVQYTDTTEINNLDPQNTEDFVDVSAQQEDGVSEVQKTEVASPVNEKTTEVSGTDGDNSAHETSQHALEADEQEVWAVSNVLDEQIETIAADSEAPRDLGQSNGESASSDNLAPVVSTDANAAVDSITNSVSVADSTPQVDSALTTSNADNTLADATNQAAEPTLEANKPLETEDSPDLRAVKIVYLGEEMSLFQPVEGDSSTTFFLSDSSLAYETLEKLLFACREILGDSLGHEDELVLDIPVLGLHIFEDSKYASNLTLSRLVEVYFHLCRNDSIESPEPLFCHLSSRVCLATQYAYLSNAAYEGKTFSEVAADYVDTPEAVAEGNEEQPETNGEKQEQNVNQNVEDQEFDQPKSEDQQLSEELAVEQTVVKDSRDEQNLGDSQEGSTEGRNIKDREDTELEHLDPQLKGNEEIVGEEYHGEVQNEQDNYGVDLNIHPADPSTDAQSILPKDLEAVKGETEELDDNYSDVGFDGEQLIDTEDFSTSHDPATIASGKDGLSVAEASEPTDNQTLPQGEHDDIVADSKRDDENGDPDEQEFLEEITYNDADAEPELLLADEGVELDLSGFEANAAPITPSKQSATKRKATEDEDDLNYLDISTPEPKRTRSSR